MISAHGATIDVTSRTVTITYSPLLAALQSTHGAAEGGASILRYFEVAGEDV